MTPIKQVSRSFVLLAVALLATTQAARRVEAGSISFYEEVIARGLSGLRVGDTLSVPEEPLREVVVALPDFQANGTGICRISPNANVRLQGAIPAYRDGLIETSAYMRVEVKNDTGTTQNATAHIHIEGGFMELAGSIATPQVETIQMYVNYQYITGNIFSIPGLAVQGGGIRAGLYLDDSVLSTFDQFVYEELDELHSPILKEGHFLSVDPVIPGRVHIQPLDFDIPLREPVRADDIVTIYYRAYFYALVDPGGSAFAAQWSFEDPAGVGFDGNYGGIEFRPLAVPEPSTLAMVGFPIMAGLVGIIRRKRPT
jgi:hypothetical protein